MATSINSLVRSIIALIITLYIISLISPEIYHSLINPFLDNIEFFIILIILWFIFSILKKGD